MCVCVYLCAGRPPGPEMEYCTDRESYSLAAGLALGMVCLGVSVQVLQKHAENVILYASYIFLESNLPTHLCNLALLTVT